MRDRDDGQALREPKPDLAGCRRAVRSAEQLAIFDLDGTLIDSTAVMTDAFTGAYREVVGTGEPPLDRFFEMMGAPFVEILARLKLPREIDPVFRRLAEGGVDRIELDLQAVRACSAVKQLGVPVTLFTGKDRARTIRILRELGIDDLFDALVAGDDIAAGKPAPDGVLRLCEKFGTSPEYAVMVGDSAFDMMAGRAAGTTTVGCLWGSSDATTLRRAGADHIVSRSGDLAGVLLRWVASKAAS